MSFCFVFAFCTLLFHSQVDSTFFYLSAAALAAWLNSNELKAQHISAPHGEIPFHNAALAFFLGFHLEIPLAFFESWKIPRSEPRRRFRPFKPSFRPSLCEASDVCWSIGLCCYICIFLGFSRWCLVSCMHCNMFADEVLDLIHQILSPLRQVAVASSSFASTMWLSQNEGNKHLLGRWLLQQLQVTRKNRVHTHVNTLM